MPIRNLLLFVVSFLAAGNCLAIEAADDAFQKLVDDLWQYDLQHDPLQATNVGEHRYNDRLPDVSLKATEVHQQKLREFLKRTKALNAKELSADEQVNYTIFRQLLENRIREYEFKSHLIPITNRWGFHVGFPELRRKAPLKTVQDYENYIARLNAFRQYSQQHIEVMREGIKQRMVLPAVVLRGFEETINAHIVTDPKRSLLFEPFENFPERIGEADRERLTSAGVQAIKESVVPGYVAFGEFFTVEYLPAARGSIGAAALPNGRAFYRSQIQKFTTLDLTPDEIHELGKSEVKRIRAEMKEVIARTKFKGDIAEFVADLRTNEEFYPKTAEELMQKTALVLKKMDGELPTLFKRLPRTPYGIRRVPDYIAPKTTTAYYQLPAGDGSRAGFYFVNVYNLKSRPLYDVEALSLHEAVPGHHLQLALQQELDLPDFRRFASFTAFVEGWALYAERLGLEVGFYTDPYSDFGRLSFESWRACRLVVDTGIHNFGWTREQAIEYMAENTALTRHNIEAEVDRYISWPGQALGYKIGELKIRELRALAEKELGDEFDIREFHDVVLRGGSIPLNVLEANVKRWLANH